MAQNKGLSLGGMGSPCCCGGVCAFTVCVTDCSSATVNGVTVQILSGATVVASGTTIGSGCVTLIIPGPGTYTITASIGGAVFYTFTGSLACNGLKILSTTNLASGFGCCSGTNLPLPTTLYLSICSQMYTLTASVVSHIISGWSGGGSIITAGVAVMTTHGGCCIWDGTTLQTDTTNIGFALQCPTGGMSVANKGVASSTGCGTGFTGKVGLANNYQGCFSPINCARL